MTALIQSGENGEKNSRDSQSKERDGQRCSKKKMTIGRENLRDTLRIQDS